MTAEPLAPADEVALRIIAGLYTDQSSMRLASCFATIDVLRDELVRLRKENAKLRDVLGAWQVQKFIRNAQSNPRNNDDWFEEGERLIKRIVAALEARND